MCDCFSLIFVSNDCRSDRHATAASCKQMATDVSYYIVPSPGKLRYCGAQFFRKFGPCWHSAQFLPYSAIFAQLLFSCPLGGRDRPVTSNVTTVIPTKKGVDATTSWHFVAVQAPGVYCRKMQCNTVPKTDKPACRRSFLHPRCSCQPSVSLREWLTKTRHRLRSGKSLHVMIYVTN